MRLATYLIAVILVPLTNLMAQPNDGGAQARLFKRLPLVTAEREYTIPNLLPGLAPGERIHSERAELVYPIVAPGRGVSRALLADGTLGVAFRDEPSRRFVGVPGVHYLPAAAPIDINGRYLWFEGPVSRERTGFAEPASLPRRIVIATSDLSEQAVIVWGPPVATVSAEWVGTADGSGDVIGALRTPTDPATGTFTLSVVRMSCTGVLRWHLPRARELYDGDYGSWRPSLILGDGHVLLDSKRGTWVRIDAGSGAIEAVISTAPMTGPTESHYFPQGTLAIQSDYSRASGIAYWWGEGQISIVSEDFTSLGRTGQILLDTLNGSVSVPKYGEIDRAIRVPLKSVVDDESLDSVLFDLRASIEPLAINPKVNALIFPGIDSLWNTLTPTSTLAYEALATPRRELTMDDVSDAFYVDSGRVSLIRTLKMPNDSTEVWKYGLYPVQAGEWVFLARIPSVETPFPTYCSVVEDSVYICNIVPGVDTTHSFQMTVSTVSLDDGAQSTDWSVNLIRRLFWAQDALRLSGQSLLSSVEDNPIDRIDVAEGKAVINLNLKTRQAITLDSIAENRDKIMVIRTSPDCVTHLRLTGERWRINERCGDVETSVHAKVRSPYLSESPPYVSLLRSTEKDFRILELILNTVYKVRKKNGRVVRKRFPRFDGALSGALLLPPSIGIRHPISRLALDEYPFLRPGAGQAIINNYDSGRSYRVMLPATERALPEDRSAVAGCLLGERIFVAWGPYPNPVGPLADTRSHLKVTVYVLPTGDGE